MKYLKCKCGNYIFVTDLQSNCNHCGHLMNLDNMQRSIGIMKETGLYLSSPLMLLPKENSRFDMNRWVDKRIDRPPYKQRWAS